jgi:hypothetical protein
VGEILAAKGLVRETAALIATYDDMEARYFDWRARYGEQFSGRGTGLYAENPTASHRDTDWSRKDVVILSSSGGDARLVNDEGILAERVLTLDAPGEILGTYLRKAAKGSRYIDEDAEDARKALPKGLFTGCRCTSTSSCSTWTCTTTCGCTWPTSTPTNTSPPCATSWCCPKSRPTSSTSSPPRWTC